MKKPKVVGITQPGYGAEVEFDDGHRMYFEGYAHGVGYNIEGLRGVTLIDGQRQKVFHYNGRLYRSGPSDNEYKIAMIDSDYPQQRVATYWQAARDYLEREYFRKPETDKNPELWFPWRVICCEAGTDLSSLKEGTAKLVPAKA